ncbi:MAG: putative molybdenum carrier protein [Blastocatellia bacterium]
MLKRIVSGGQTGVDRAALDVAMALSNELGISVGGYCPKNRIAEDGAIDDKYPLTETSTSAYAQRTDWNVKHSDGTLLLSRGKLTKGSALTLKFAKQRQKPFFVVDLSQDTTNIRLEIISWLAQNSISVLNIAGSRESTSPGIYTQAYELLEKLLLEIKLYFSKAA